MVAFALPPSPTVGAREDRAASISSRTAKSTVTEIRTAPTISCCAEVTSVIHAGTASGRAFARVYSRGGGRTKQSLVVHSISRDNPESLTYTRVEAVSNNDLRAEGAPEYRNDRLRDLSYARSIPQSVTR